SGGGGPFNIGQGDSDIGVVVTGTTSAPDVLFSNQVGGDVSMLLNNGTGGFGTGPVFRADNDVYGIGPAHTTMSLHRTAGVDAQDFNNDGIQDLVAINPGANTLGVLLGLGNGSYLNPIVTQLGFGPAAQVVQDFDGDGKQDVALLDAQH